MNDSESECEELLSSPGSSTPISSTAETQHALSRLYGILNLLSLIRPEMFPLSIRITCEATQDPRHDAGDQTKGCQKVHTLWLGLLKVFWRQPPLYMDMYVNICITITPVRAQNYSHRTMLNVLAPIKTMNNDPQRAST